MSLDRPLIVPQSMLDALDQAIDARLKARAEAEGNAELAKPLWLSRQIWFWQSGRYGREGWTVQWCVTGHGLSAFLSEIEGRIWPTAVKVVDRRTGEPFDFEAYELANPPPGSRVVQEVGRRPRLEPDPDARSDALEDRIREASARCCAAASEVARTEAGIRSVMAGHGK